MSFEFSLVIFTVLSQLAVGLAIFVCVDTFRVSRLDMDEVTRRRGWFWAFIASLIGLVASLFHLGHPLDAWKALFNLGESCLSREVLIFAIFCALTFCNIIWRHRWLSLCTALLGLIGLVAQGMTYAPPAIPSLNNAFPMFIFLLSALAMGAAGRVLLYPDKIFWLARPFIIALFAILLIAPEIWLSGTATMRMSGGAWLMSPLFWLGLAFLILAFVATFWPRFMVKWQIVSLVCGIALTRMVFFADSFHTAMNLGLPYN